MPPAAAQETERPAPSDDPAFLAWYAKQAKQYELNPDPTTQQYDYREAFRRGFSADASGHWPSLLKPDDHPNLVVGGFNTKTGERVAGTPQASEVELIRLGWAPETAKRLSAERPATLDEIISELAKVEGVSPLLALAVAKKESSLDPKAVGDGGKAIGLFQLHEGAAKDTGTADRSDPVQNIRGGLKYLKQLSDRYEGDVQKTLMAYNGGMKWVDDGNPTPQAQAYAAEILAGLSKEMRTQPKGTTPPKASPASADRQPPVAAPAYTGGVEGSRLDPAAAGKRNIHTEVATGFVKRAGETITNMGQWLRDKVPALDRGPEVTFSTERTTGPEKFGAGAEQIAEFALPATAISKTLGASKIARWLVSKGVPANRAVAAGLAVEGSVQAPTAYGVATSQGATPSESTFAAVTSGVAPVLGKFMEATGPWIRERAVQQMSKVFARGLENNGPKIKYALKTGDHANKDVMEAVKIVRQAASDTLDLPIQASWGKWQTQLAQDVTRKGQSLQEALKGELGQEMIPKEPIVKALDDLINESAQHFAQVSEGGYRFLPYDDNLLKELTVLKGKLAEYGDKITVKNFVDIKRVWDEAVYSLSTVGKVGVSPEVLVSNAMKEARYTGANAIREALEDRVPEIAKLNEAFSHAKRLEDLVNKLYKVSPALPSGVQNLATAVGAGVGAVMMPGGYAGHVLGAGIGAGTVRLLTKALESPAWQTVKPVVKDRLAQALMSGNAEAVRQIVAPIVAAQAVGSPQ